MKKNKDEGLRQRLREYFASREEVRLAYLFGSRAGGKTGPLSDFDFGVLLTDDADPDARYHLAGELAGLLGVPRVDVIPLEKAPIELAYNVVATGERLYEQDVATRVDFEAKVLSKYGDYLPVLRRQREEIIRECER